MITGTILFTLLIVVGGAISINEPWDKNYSPDYRSTQEILEETDSTVQDGTSHQ